MTKQAFVKNTMSTIYDQSSVKITKAWEMNMEAYLKVSDWEKMETTGLIYIIIIMIVRIYTTLSNNIKFCNHYLTGLQSLGLLIWKKDQVW